MNEKDVIPLKRVIADPTNVNYTANTMAPEVMSPDGQSYEVITGGRVDLNPRTVGQADTIGTTLPVAVGAAAVGLIVASETWITSERWRLANTATSRENWSATGGVGRAAALMASIAQDDTTQICFAQGLSPDDVNPNAIIPDASANFPAVASIGFSWTGNAGGELAQLRMASAVNVALQSGAGAQLVRSGGDWAINHTPVANTQATITRAAVAGQRHVCTSIDARLIGVAAIAAPILVNLRDGATGVGTILWSGYLFAPAAGSKDFATISGLSIVGSVNTAMTLEFAAGPGATNFESVALTGYTAA